MMGLVGWLVNWVVCQMGPDMLSHNIFKALTNGPHEESVLSS